MNFKIKTLELRRIYVWKIPKPYIIYITQQLRRNVFNYLWIPPFDGRIPWELKVPPWNFPTTIKNIYVLFIVGSGKTMYLKVNTIFYCNCIRIYRNYSKILWVLFECSKSFEIVLWPPWKLFKAGLKLRSTIFFEI